MRVSVPYYGSANIFAAAILPGGFDARPSDYLWLHAVSDAFIAIAYLWIPLAILYLLWRRRDVPFRGFFWLFGAFLAMCGVAQLVEIYTEWNPSHGLSAWVKAATALVSLLTAVVFARVLPRALILPGPDALQRTNEELERRVQARTRDLRASNERLEREARQRNDAEDEVRRLNDSLQNRVSELQTLLDLLPVGIGIARDTNSRELRTNQVFARLLGIVSQTRPSLSAPPIEMPVTFRFYRGERELPAEELPLRRALAENRSVLDEELRIVRADGQESHVLASAVPLRDKHGHARGAVATLQDITVQKRESLERLAFERRMQESQKLESLGVLAGGIAHDFNNLLTGILGNASLARLELPSGHAAVRSSLDNLEQAAIRAADLCKQMLAYAGKGRFLVEPVSISRLVRETLDLLKVSIGKRAELELELTNGLPAFQGDATQIRQILMNLVLNASEAIGERSGVITIRTGEVNATREFMDEMEFGRELSEGDYVYVEVIDNGTGMDTATVERIFDPFFTTKFTGRGLGLAAVLGIVRSHGGAIKVHSEPGQGTSFRVYLPAIDVPATPAEPIVHASSMGRASGSILLVDDEDAVRGVAERILTGAGYEVTVACDGREAIEMFQENGGRFDVVLMDLTMPHIDGEEAFYALREVDRDACVLLMSGFNEQETIERFGASGLAGFVPKPFSADLLLTRVREAVSRRQPAS